MTICRVMESPKGLVQVQVLENGHLSWSMLQLSDKSMHLSTDVRSVPTEDILHVKIKPQKRKSLSDSVDASSSLVLRTHRLLVHYVKRSEKQQLRMGSCDFQGTLSECQRLARDINAKRDGTRDEKRKFLVLINPISGYSRGPRIFRSRVEPLFKACDITYDTIVSKKGGDFAHAVVSRNLTEYSGIVIFGGDGSINETVNALLIRAMKEAKQDLNDAQCQLVPAAVPIGIIPTGSGNFLCRHLHGSCDVTTAAIHIIRGKTVPLNAVTLHEPGRFLCFSFLQQHIGFVGDIMRRMEINRWMGPARYTVVSHTSILKRRLMAADLTCSLHGSVDDLVGCRETTSTEASRRSSTLSRSTRSITLEDTQQIYASREIPDDGAESSAVDLSMSVDRLDQDGVNEAGSNDVDEYATEHEMMSSSGVDENKEYRICSAEMKEEDDTRVHAQGNVSEHIQGDVYNICLMVTRLLTKEGTQVTKLGHHAMSLIVVKKCSLPDFVKHMVNFKDNVPGFNNYAFVECREVQSVTLTLTSPSSREQRWYINSDGESILLNSSVCHFRLHPQVFTAFGSLNPV